MTKNSTTTWTCDYCNTTCELKLDSQPATWKGIIVTHPDGTSFGGTSYHMCNTCFRLFEAWAKDRAA